ncbi:outer membrane beta-barrel protein [Sinimarinibacterium thermocellulolyticum]|uniref:Outer membrane beta-barrel protein n=1 Tax=Sinimarinibacterium thermocellulolyticum TaxID=3170016 RepID=A0ABV2A9K0_9GAMM
MAQQPTGIALGSGWSIEPSLATALEYDDNFYRQADAERTATGTLITPQLDLVYLTRKNQLRLSQRGEFATYNTGNFDDYAHYDIGLDARINEGGQHRFKLSALRDEGSDPFGTERSELTPATQRDVDEFVLTAADIAYTYGAPSARLNLTLFAGGTSKEYQNNRDLTRILDRDRVGGGSELRVRISPRTGLLFDVSHYEVQFDTVVAGSTRDGSEQRARVGLQWQATATTTGRVRVGALRREMDAADRDDFSGADWEAAISWQPTSYAEVVFESGRGIQEAYFEESDFIDVEHIGLRWYQQWSAQWYSQLGVRGTRYTFEGFDREDDVIQTDALLGLQLTRQFGIEAGLLMQDRDSNQDQFDFDRLISHLRLRLRL